MSESTTLHDFGAVPVQTASNGKPYVEVRYRRTLGEPGWLGALKAGDPVSAGGQNWRVDGLGKDYRVDGTVSARRVYLAPPPDAPAQAPAQAPIYNSPPPADLGTRVADPEALAARFGRKAVAGAEVLHFSVYGLARGDNGSPDGTLHKARVGRGQQARTARVVQVARTPRRYLSRDTLEDFDLFGAEPGGSYEWEGVEVEPTPEERAADEAAEARKVEEKRAKEEAVAKAEAEAQARKAAWEAATAGLEVTEAGPAGYTLTGEKHGTAQRIALPDGALGWVGSWSTHDDGGTYYYLPADAARAARLASAFASGITPEQAAEWLGKYSGCRGADVYRAVAAADPATQEKLRENALRLAEEKLEKRKADERRSTLISARGQVTGEFQRPVPAPGSRPRFVEVRFDGPALDRYCEVLEARGYGGDHPRLEGVTVVLAPPAPAKGKKKPAPLPERIRVHNFCTAPVLPYSYAETLGSLGLAPETPVPVAADYAADQGREDLAAFLREEAARA